MLKLLKLHFGFSCINPSHPNISKHILHTVLYTFPIILTRRVSQSRAAYVGDQFVYSQEVIV